MSDLKAYLIRQKRRLELYQSLAKAFWAVVLVLSLMSLFQLLQHSSEFFVARTETVNHFFFLLKVGSVFVGVVWLFRKLRRVDLRTAAAEVERQSQYFNANPEQRSELVSSASFLMKESEGSADFQSAHLEVWERRLRAFSVQIVPRKLLILALLSIPLFVVGFQQFQNFEGHRLPNEIRPWFLKIYDEQLPYSGAVWRQKTGSISAVKGSRVRFEAPKYGIFQTYVFLKTGERKWRYIACDDFCEFKVTERGRYAVGTLLYRSAKYPLQALPDEPPKAVLFVRDGEDLVPNARINVLNKTDLEIHLLASDDLEISKIELMHRFEEKESSLLTKDLALRSFKEDFTIDMAEWKGGEHQIYLKVRDFTQESISSPLTIVYADEEFLREQRIASVRALLDEWVHILGDLLESQIDQRVKAELPGRLLDLEYPGNLEESLLSVFVEELRRLGDRIQNQIVVAKQLAFLPELIRLTEKQILYGLSLIFQEKAGDVNASNESLRDSQKDLQSLLDRIRSGEEKMSSEKLQEAFEKLAKQLEELQNKVRNLPQGPSDNLINREALDEQVAESEELEDRIAEIEKKLAEGNDEQALRELESLVNQLSILSKEIEGSLDQWQKNLDQGAMQASEKFQKELENIQKQQEKLAEKSDKLKEQKEALEKKERETFKPSDPKELKELKEVFENLESEQTQLRENFTEAVEDFDGKLEGTEWEQVFRTTEAKEKEQMVQTKMEEAENFLRSQEAFEAVTTQKEAADLLREAQEGQKQMREQVKEMAQQQQAVSGRQLQREKVEIIDSEGKGKKERRRKIMNSLRQKVDEKYQESHERYFEDLLQR